MVDYLPNGKSVQLGMTFTSSGWQTATGAMRTPETSMSWLSHFAHTVLQLPNVAAVVYGRGIGHIAANKGYTAGLLMWWKGPQGHIMFEEVRSGSASTYLSSFSMRTRHPNDWMKIRFVLWLLQDETEYIQEDAMRSREIENTTPGQESPNTRLSTITEEPSDMTEDVLFRHDEPNWEQYDLCHIGMSSVCKIWL
jgi:hypothetical protein